MDVMTLAKTRYEELMHRMEQDMAVAAQYKDDLTERYKPNLPLDHLMAIQSQVLRIQDYTTQKFNNLVEIQRGYDDLCKAIEEEEAKAE